MTFQLAVRFPWPGLDPPSATLAPAHPVCPHWNWWWTHLAFTPCSFHPDRSHVTFLLQHAPQEAFLPSQMQGSVGCIYASEPFNSSLIYYQCLFHSNSIIKHQKQLKYILSIFLVFLLTLFPCHLYFLHYMPYEGSCHLLPSRPFDSRLRKHLPTHRLHPTIWPPDGQGAKVPGK